MFRRFLHTGFFQTPSGDSQRLRFLPDICNANIQKTTFSSVLNEPLNGLQSEALVKTICFLAYGSVITFTVDLYTPGFWNTTVQRPLLEYHFELSQFWLDWGSRFIQWRLLQRLSFYNWHSFICGRVYPKSLPRPLFAPLSLAFASKHWSLKKTDSANSIRFNLANLFLYWAFIPYQVYFVNRSSVLNGSEFELGPYLGLCSEEEVVLIILGWWISTV